MNITKKSSLSPSMSPFTAFLEDTDDKYEFDMPSALEQRIYDFLESQQIFPKSPIDKMYDYFDRKREEVVRSSSMISLPSSEQNSVNRPKLISCDEGMWGINQRSITNASNGSPNLKAIKGKFHLQLNIRKSHSEI